MFSGMAISALLMKTIPYIIVMKLVTGGVDIAVTYAKARITKGVEIK